MSKAPVKEEEMEYVDTRSSKWPAKEPAKEPKKQPATKVPKIGEKVPWKTSKKPVSEKVPWYGAKKTVKDETTDIRKWFVDDEAEDDFGGEEPDDSFNEGDEELSEGEQARFLEEAIRYKQSKQKKLNVVTTEDIIKDAEDAEIQAKRLENKHLIL